ncbi:MAG: hypothetical protein IJW12_00210, partial [Opitutales bacterium]|nr:hypothetical protein [Opitutales bacterium]
QRFLARFDLMKIYIDTNTFPATPGVYADAAKTKPLPRVIPLVQGFRGQIEIAFIGELAPVEGSAVTLAMRPYGSRKEVLCTAPVTVNTETGEDGVPACASVSLAVNTDALAAAFADRETLNLLCGVVVSDDAAAFPTRVEWQLVLSVSASALDNGVPPDISPTAAEKLREDLESVKTDLAENYIDRSSYQTITGMKRFSTGSAQENAGGGLFVGRLAQDGSEGLWLFDGAGLRLEASQLSSGLVTRVGLVEIGAESVTGRNLSGSFLRALSPLAGGGFGGVISIPYLPAGTPVGQETLALKSDIAAAVTSVYRYRGTAATVADLPADGNAIGDVSNVADTGQNYAWDGEAWDALAGDTFATKYELSAAVDAEATRAREAEEAKVNFFDTVVPDANDNAHIYGYVGTLGDLGAFGGACYINRLTLRTRLNTGTLANPTIALYARILKVENGAWVVAAQSSNAHKWGELGYDADATFSMVAVPGVIPPSADEKIAIVLVNNPNAAAGVSNGFVSCRVVSGTGKGGGITAALGTPDGTTGNANWHPYIRLRFAPLGGLTKEAVAKNPSWTLTHAYGSEITPVNFEFETESTGGDFGLRYEQGGTSRKLVFPDTSGTLALEAKTVPKSDYDALLARVEALEAAANG